MKLDEAYGEDVRTVMMGFVDGSGATEDRQVNQTEDEEKSEGREQKKEQSEDIWTFSELTEHQASHSKQHSTFTVMPIICLLLAATLRSYNF